MLVGVGAEVTTETDYQKFLLDKITELSDLIKGRTSLADVRTQYREELGIPGKETAVAGITREVLDVEELLDKLEGDIAGRISGKLVTEAQRRRYQATEERPLREQLADLMRAETSAGVGLTGARGELAEMMRLEEARRTEEETGITVMLPSYKEALTYESPEQKSARELKEKQTEWKPD